MARDASGERGNGKRPNRDRDAARPRGGLRKGARAVAFLLRMGFPWAGGRNDPWSRAARRALLRRWPLWLRPIVWPLCALVWPAASLWQSVAASRRAVASPPRLWLACWKAALGRNIPPAEFVFYRLHREGALEEEGWRFNMETANLVSLSTSPETAALIRDKREFHAWLTALGAPAVPLLDALPARGEAVTKPRLGLRGEGVLFWTPEGGMWRPRPGYGRVRMPPTPEAKIMRLIAERDLILQPAIPPHPALRHPLVARILTMRTGAGPKAADPLTPRRPVRVAPRGARATGGERGPLKARAVAAYAQLPARFDRASLRGPVRLLDMATGEIRRAGPGARLVAAGVRPRVPVEGARLPGWKKLLAALEAAHDAMEGHAPCLGWDAIWGPDGPLVLEANIGLGMGVWQADRLEPARMPILLDR